MSSREILNYVKAQPFRPFCIVMNRGRSFDIRHPEMVRVGQDFLNFFTFVSESPDRVDHWETGSLMLVESISERRPALSPSSRLRRLQARNERFTAMMTRETMHGYVKAEPFRAFRVHLVSGRTFDVRHPKMIKVLRSTILIFKPADNSEDLSDEWDTVSLMLIESISHLETPVH